MPEWRAPAATIAALGRRSESRALPPLIESLSLSEAFVRDVAPWVAHLADACAVLVALIGVVRTLLYYIIYTLRTAGRTAPPTAIRLDLGRSLALSLEFLLAADIIQTALSPSPQELLQLGAVAVIRTGLNYFLGKELEQEAREVAMRPSSSAAEPADRPPAG